MNRTKTLCKISLVSIALILLMVSTALAATENDTGNVTINDDYISSTLLPTNEKSASLQTTETRITTSGHASGTRIYGDNIVWVDHRDANESNWKSDVYMYDISTKKETKITTSGDASCSNIYGNKIVWSNFGYPNEVYMYNLSTSQESVISDSYNNYVDSLSIYGDKVAWCDSLDDSSIISVYDLSTKEETTIAYDAYSPAIYGNRIVYVSYRNKGSNIYMYDLSTKKETQITTSGSAYEPAIYGNRIVYEVYRDWNSDIYMYDLSTKKETQITSSPDAQTHPAIYGNRIVWEDDGGEDDGGVNHGIYMYDISTKQKMKISKNGSAYSPAIYGDDIVWQYGLYENSDIYMITVSSEPQPKPPVAAFSASPTSGKAPLKVQFTDKSTESPTSWKWSFGDGKYSTSKSPAHTYGKAGKYTVALTASNSAGSNTLKKSGYVNVAAPLKAPVAAFSASPRSGKAPLKVQFTDKSANSPTSWKWSFGDGTYSTAKNPAHTYSKAGKYTISLTVKNTKGSNTKKVSGYIVVSKK